MTRPRLPTGGRPRRCRRQRAALAGGLSAACAPPVSFGGAGTLYSRFHTPACAQWSDPVHHLLSLQPLPQKAFVVLDKEELRGRLGVAVEQVVDLLCISDAEATRALRFYKWDLSKLQVGAVGDWGLRRLKSWDDRRGGAAWGPWAWSSVVICRLHALMRSVAGVNEQPAAGGRPFEQLLSCMRCPAMLLPSSRWLAAHVLRLMSSNVSLCPRSLQEEWFTDPDGVRGKVGLLDEQPSTSRKEVGGPRLQPPSQQRATSATLDRHLTAALLTTPSTHHPSSLSASGPAAGDLQDLL